MIQAESRFEDRLLTELKQVVAARAAADLGGARTPYPDVPVRRVNRRRLALAGAAASIALATAVVFAFAAGPDRPRRPAAQAPGQLAATPPVALRLFIVPGGFISPGGMTWQGPDGRQVGLKPTDGLREVLPDGRLVTRTVPGLQTIFAAVPLPDGGFVALGQRTPTEPISTTRPHASPTPAAPSVPTSVAVVRPDGSVRLLTDTAATAGLIGADDSRLYLSTAGAPVVAMDLTTGRQQALDWRVNSSAVLAGGSFAQLDAGPDAFAPTTCTLRLLDARTGAQTARQSLRADDCRTGNVIALSPDRHWLAIAHQPGLTSGAFLKQLGVILVNVETGQQTDHLLDDSTAVGDNGTLFFDGMTWLNTGQVRVAWTRLPDHVDRLYDLSEVLRTKTVTVPTR